MHIVDNKLVGTIVSDVYSENGSVIIVLSDNDTTPVREMQTYSYIQTKELAEIGIAINSKGVVTIPRYTLEEFNNGLDPNLYAISVKYNGELYQIGLADFLEFEVGDDVDYDPYEEGAFPGQTIGAVIPPFSAENAKQVVSVNDETGKLEWRDETEELPFINSGDAGKVLKVNSGATGTEWGDVPNELPSVTGNAGKVLKVNSGATGTEWGDVPNELPSVTGNAGKVLKVNSGATGTEWGDIPNELPMIASGDAGKVLKVNAGETGVEWGSAGGGGTKYLHTFSYAYVSGPAGYFKNTVYCNGYYIDSNPNTTFSEYLYNNGFRTNSQPAGYHGINGCELEIKDPENTVNTYKPVVAAYASAANSVPVIIFNDGRSTTLIEEQINYTHIAI